MNCSEASQLSILDYMTARGFIPVSRGHRFIQFHSPLRNDRNPSFSVYIDSNKWYDYGLGRGGDLIDLVNLLYNFSTSQALKHIETVLQMPLPAPSSFIRHRPDGDSLPNITFSAIKDQMLIKYLEKRAITENVWRNCQQLSQVEYDISTKSGITKRCANLAFKNDKGGYELRGTGSFKRCIAPKHITTIPGTSRHLNLFEGFFSYLSALVFFKTTSPHNDTIILNSLSSINKIIPLILDYGKVNCFLDNDEPGHNAFKKLSDRFSHVFDKSIEYYPNHNDFNDLII